MVLNGIGINMKIDKKFCDLAISLAKTSNHQFRVGAVLVSKKDIISVGVNSTDKSHPLQKYYNDRCREFKVEIHNNIHAEMDAILKYRRMRIDIPKLKIFIARINKNGIIVPGYPCPSCSALLNDNSVNTIIYSTSDGFDYEQN
jgi:deoxycytidylate deaminase